MKTLDINQNGGDAPEASTTIYLCQPFRAHNRIECTACGDSFVEPWIRFFYEGNPDYPVCKKCALRHGFTVTGNRGAPLRCRRAKGGAIEISEEPGHELGRPRIIKPPMVGSSKAFTRARALSSPENRKILGEKRIGNLPKKPEKNYERRRS